MLFPTPLKDIVFRSAAPDAVRPWLEQLCEQQPATGEMLEADEQLAARLVAIAEASRSLSRLLLADPGALEVVMNLDSPIDVGGAPTPEAMVRAKRLELLRIAARDLARLDPVDVVGASLAELADGVFVAACRLADAGGLSVIAMGKHGARELNYSSDVDILFVGTGDAGDVPAARRLLDVARGAFRVDAALRPEGRDGPLVRSLDSYLAYWDRWARPWEFQALLKSRLCAGDTALGAAFEAQAQERVWGRRADADALAELRSMKQRAEQEMERRGVAEREIKRGRGGIRDIEFAVQLLQLVHGPADPALRIRATLPALHELSAAGYIGAGDGAYLSLAYRFLRIVEHRLQLVEEAQVHTVPTDDQARSRLARVVGFTDSADGTALQRFDDLLARYQAAVRSIHERLFFRPLLEAFTSDAATLDESAVLDRLSAFGFRDAERTRQGILELTRGLTRSSRLMRQLLPLLLDWCSEAPDPDLALFGLRTLADGAHRRDVLVAAFRDSPEAARRLCLLAGTSKDLLGLLRRHPDLVRDLGDPATLAIAPPGELLETAIVKAEQSPERVAHSLRGLVGTEIVRCAARDILGTDDIVATGRSLATLADVVVTAALHVVRPQVPFAVIAMGRLGGSELSYGSDLDVLLVYDGASAPEAREAEEAASSLLRLLNGATPAERVLTTDVSLRPEGKQGLLARSLEGYAEYYRRWMQTWERQALLRARALAGDAGVAARFMALASEAVFGTPLDDEDVREIRRMKARIERERIPPGADPQFHLKLGPGSLSDVEWTAQLLQLQTGVRAAGTVEALALLEAGGHLTPQDASALRNSYRFCERTRNRWHLVGSFLAAGGPGGAKTAGADSLPQRPEQLGRLARSLGTSVAGLRDEYRRYTRRARQVTERVFYGVR
jgi:glutamate-ammonia-ligase adenylyltransferase